MSETQTSFWLVKLLPERHQSKRKFCSCFVLVISSFFLPCQHTGIKPIPTTESKHKDYGSAQGQPKHTLGTITVLEQNNSESPREPTMTYLHVVSGGWRYGYLFPICIDIKHIIRAHHHFWEGKGHCQKWVKRCYFYHNRVCLLSTIITNPTIKLESNVRWCFPGWLHSMWLFRYRVAWLRGHTVL